MEYFKDLDTFLESFFGQPSFFQKKEAEEAAKAADKSAPASKEKPAAPATGTAAPAKTDAPAAAPAAAPAGKTSTAAAPSPAVTAANDAAVKEPAQKPSTLQERLKEWIQTYSQAFKFINDRPLTTEYKKDGTGQFDMLMNVIVTEKRSAVKEAIEKVVEILLNKGFEGQQVLIIGHTSTPGPKGREVPYNQSLSERRAGIVFNSIRELSLRDKKDLSKIKFSVVGKGLTDPIIQNDKDLQPLKLKQMDGEFDSSTLLNLSKSVEERQKINRRVIITLPNYKEPVPVVKVAPVVKPEPVKKDPVAGIKDLDIKGITFFDDSYILTTAGKQRLDKIVEAIESREKTQQKIKKIYIAAHTEKGNGDEKREEMMYVLSLNRSFVVEDYLKERLPADIGYVRYGCGSKVGVEESDLRGFEDEKRVEMTFDVDLPKARAAYEAQKKQFKAESSKNIIENDGLKNNIITTLTSYFNDQAVRATLVDDIAGKKALPEYCEKIPREFWLDTDYTKKGEANPADFKTRVENLVATMNKKYKVDIPVRTFFHKDLARFVK